MTVGDINRSWIYGLVFLILMSIGYIFFISGLGEFDQSFEQIHREDYRRAVVLENLLSVKGSQTELGYTYDRRRALLPAEFFTGEAGESGIGYRTRTVEGKEHCYIPRVAGLDGEEYGFKLRPLYPPGETAGGEQMSEEGYRQLGCTELDVDLTKAVYSPAMLVRKSYDNPKLPVRLYVYSIQ